MVEVIDSLIDCVSTLMEPDGGKCKYGGMLEELNAEFQECNETDYAQLVRAGKELRENDRVIMRLM